MNSLTTTTTVVAGVAAGVGTIASTIDKDGHVIPKRRNELIGTTVFSATGTIVSVASGKAQLNDIYEKYASAYVSSMSDEELVSALQGFGELPEEEIDSENVKTL